VEDLEGQRIEHIVGTSPQSGGNTRRPEGGNTCAGNATTLAARDDVASHVLHATAPRPGEQIPLRGGPVIEIVEVAEPAAHLVTATEFYGPGIRALQLVHADDRGRWPWEVRYRGVQGGQPVLGVRAAPVSAA
jgi:hypothetical protein